MNVQKIYDIINLCIFGSMSLSTVILANGSFPQHEIPLGYLRSAARIVCCDGSSGNLIRNGFDPYAIIGDLDSVDREIAVKYADRIFPDKNDDINDLTKSVNWCIERSYKDVIIIGATGKREDHTIGNISLLAEYARSVNVKMITDTGIFIPFLESCSVSAIPGQQVSVFSIDPRTEISSEGLKYKLDKLKLRNWWRGTLNEASGESFTLSFSGGPLLVYLKFID
jgi:thiamine pyrophosphokinase